MIINSWVIANGHMYSKKVCETKWRQGTTQQPEEKTILAAEQLNFTSCQSSSNKERSQNMPSDSPAVASRSLDLFTSHFLTCV